MDDVTDVSFDDASDVGSIQYRLHPIDVGWDLRETGHVIQIDDAPMLRVSYPDAAGERRVMSGTRAEVVARLRALGFEVVNG